MTDNQRRNSEDSEQTDEERFVCPDCSEEIIVNAGVKAAILESGCPVCTAPITEAAFE